MSRIRGAGNKETELRMIRLLRACGIIGWRRRWPLFGRPDFVFPAARLAVFVDGCFWHGCPRHYTKPANNRDFWRQKLEADRKSTRLNSSHTT
jgi:DNA mismatch endonuclease (patch repair protein)